MSSCCAGFADYTSFDRSCWNLIVLTLGTVWGWVSCQRRQLISCELVAGRSWQHLVIVWQTQLTRPQWRPAKTILITNDCQLVLKAFLWPNTLSCTTLPFLGSPFWWLDFLLRNATFADMVAWLHGHSRPIDAQLHTHTQTCPDLGRCEHVLASKNAVCYLRLCEPRRVYSLDQKRTAMFRISTSSWSWLSRAMDYNFLDSYQAENDSGLLNSVLDIWFHSSQKLSFAPPHPSSPATDSKGAESKGYVCSLKNVSDAYKLHN